MIFGMTPFTFFHVLLSLIGIVSGFVVVLGFIGGKRLDRWTTVFLATTVLTSVTGFLFPVHHFMPSHAMELFLWSCWHSRFMRFTFVASQVRGGGFL